ncbi:FAD-binding protein [Balneolaceae bacterium YR4-1]|uniref:FAD-binding protein n=2 Tax=Halalkalibaculum roseum TaxID=2709311 RepID=A0A6M1SQ51_9BACT|nr:FAD-binding protein [Halalkalibaculum roseum]
MYEELPMGVVFPQTTTDIQKLVRKANREQFTITARSGGTSLAGQATGNGVIMDVSRHMTNIYDINAREKYAHLQPGVIRDTLNREAAAHNLLFGPDTATTNRCMIGGMIGNNSCGIYSIKHRTTREHVLEIEAVLSDGSLVRFHPVDEGELQEKMKLDTLEGHIYRGMVKLINQNREQIQEAYPHPDIIRRNTGYALDRLCEMQPFDPDGRKFNMAELLCGSEGTLAMTAAAKLQLVPTEPHRVVLAPHFTSIRKAMEATVEAVTFKPAAVELVDHIILEATKGNIEQRKNRFFLNGDPYAILIIELDGNNREELLEKATKLKKRLSELGLSNSTPIIEDEEDIKKVWNLRKAGLGLLMGLGSDQRSPSFCEDTAVRVQDLPAYVDDFQEILDKYHTDCVFYAHASVGELHLRPVIDISKPEGIQKMEVMAEEIASLVSSYRGSLSGEHGDGRARSPYIEKVLGTEMMPLLRKVKELWDPNYLFNPGKIVKPKPISENLRVSPGYTKPEVNTLFNWRKEGSFGNAVELCNGAGVCRKLAESGGTMCPSYMATKEEKDSTRGRANLFRQLFSGRQANAFESEELHDALELCISCKACKSECPANVDMARMKAEFMQGWHDRKGIKLSERFFGQAAKLYPLAAAFPGLTNRILTSPVGKELLHTFFNIHKKRTLPGFAKQTFSNWFKKRNRKNMSKKKVLLIADIFSDYHDPAIGKSAVKVLEALDYEVLLAEISDLGRPQLSKGMLDAAVKLANRNIPLLAEYVRQDIPIVGLEPSEILTLRDEYLDLCNENQLELAKTIAEQSYQFEEFIVKELKEHPKKQEIFLNGDTEIELHGHCHAKALVGNGPTLEALSYAGYSVNDLETGCCGMAGSFGYEKDHYGVSMDIGELVLFPKLRDKESELQSGSALICAPGFSCRHQIKDGTGARAYHPAELIARNLL